MLFFVVLDISRGESWSGRVCCPLPQSETCRRACVTATSHYDLFQVGITNLSNYII